MYTAPESESRNFRPTVAEIDLDAFRSNLRHVTSQLPPASRLVAVLKADGYGHGAVRLAQVAAEEGVPMLAVALLEEALDLRANEVRAPILCLGPLYTDELPVAFEYDVTPGVSDPEALRQLADLARTRGVRRFHLKLDSGMGRMGIIEDDLDEVISILDSHPLELTGIYSHYSNASSPDDPLNDEQRERFAGMVKRLMEAGFSAPLHHFSNSAGIFAHFTEESSWARSGIALYGGNPMDGEGPQLKPVLTWKTAIQRLKWLEPGEVVGYGKSYVTERRTRVATLPVGYADGYPRELSNRGTVLIRGARCPVIGRVSMDLTTVDVTHLDEVSHGDEVVLLGAQGEQSISAEEIAATIGTINYEVFTRISRRVPRRWIGGS